MFSRSFRPVKQTVIFVVAMWLLAGAANGQQPAGGTVRGEVVDQSGALVRGATVTRLCAEILIFMAMAGSALTD